MELPLLWFMLACPSGAGALGRGSVVPCAAAREAGNGHGPLLPSPCAAQKLPPLLSIQKPVPPFLCVKFKELKLIWLVWDFFSLSCQHLSYQTVFTLSYVRERVCSFILGMKWETCTESE